MREDPQPIAVTSADIERSRVDARLERLEKELGRVHERCSKLELELESARSQVAWLSRRVYHASPTSTAWRLMLIVPRHDGAIKESQ